MAEKKNVNVSENEATVNADQQTVEQPTAAATTAPAAEPEKKFTLPEWLKTTGKIIIGGLAAIGAGVITILVSDTVRSKKSKLHYTTLPIDQSYNQLTNHVDPVTQHTEFDDVRVTEF